jgi:predicted MFS family arabinose efflux permease
MLQEQPTSQPVPLTARPWYRWVVFAVANLGFTFGVMFVQLGLIAPDLMRDFSVQAQQIGILISVYSVMYALMQIPGGVLADRVGPRRVMSFFLAVGAVGMIFFGQAPTFSVSLVARVLVALGVSVLYVNKVKVIGGWFKADEFATAMGLGSSVGAVGRLLAGPALAALIGQFGWRSTYCMVGVLNLFFAVACFVIIRDRDPALEVEQEAEQEAVPRPGIVESIKMCFGNWQFVALFFVALLSYGGMMGGLGAWGIPFLMQGFGVERFDASMIMMGTALVSLVTGPMWGRISDKLLRARKPVLLIALAGCVLGVLPLVAAADRLPLAVVAGLLAFRAFFTSGLLISYTMASELVPSSVLGVAMAGLNIGPYVGGAIYQAASGFILGNPESFMTDGTPIYGMGDYQLVFLPGLVAWVVGILVVLFVNETMKKNKDDGG